MPTDIVGYTYKADLYCPKCILAVMWNGTTTERDRYKQQSAEDSLEIVADALGINRDDESTFDSGNFPKVVFRGMTQKPCAECDDPNCQQNLYASRCGSCGEVLGA